MYTQESQAIPGLKKETSDYEADDRGLDGYYSIIKEKDRLFDNLEESQAKLSRDELLDAASRVFECSVEDGLEISEKLRLTPREIAGIVSTPSFALKHEGLAAEIRNEIEMSKSKISDKVLADTVIGDISETLTGLKQEQDAVAGSSKISRFLDSKRQKTAGSPELKKILADVDIYYSRFVSRLEFKNAADWDDRSKGEKLAEDNLQRILPAMEEQYRSGDVLNALYQYLKSDDPTAVRRIGATEASPKAVVLDYLKQEGWARDDIAQLKYGPLASKDLVNNLKAFFKFDDITERKLDNCRYKPLSLVYNTAGKMAENQLVEEIDRSLRTRFPEGVEIVFDKEKKEYVVKDTRPERKGGGGKTEQEGFRSEVKEINIDGYSCISDYESINNCLFFRVEKDGKRFYTTEDGRELGKEYDDVSDIRNVNGRLVFQAEKDDKSFIVTEDGRELGKKYDYISDIENVNGHLVFIAKKDGKSFIVTEDGRELGKEYDDVLDIENVNGYFVFIVKKDDKSFIVTEDGREFGKKYDHILDIENINGRLVFRAEKDDELFIVTEDGREFGKKYDYISDIENINGRLVFQAEKDDKSFIVTEDGRELGKKYDDVSDIRDVNGRLVFQAEKDDELFIVTEDGREFSKKYDYIYFWEIENVNGHFVFIVKKDDKLFIVTEDGREFGKEYDDVSGLKSVNGRLVFQAKKDGKRFYATEDGRKLSREYKDILYTQQEKNRIIILAKGDSGRTLIKETISFGEETGSEKGAAPELNKSERNKLELLNLVHNPDKDRINDHLANRSKLKKENNKTAWQKVKSGVKNSRALSEGLSGIAPQIPGTFLDTMKAQADKNPVILKKYILRKMFPEIYGSDKRSNGFGGFSNFDFLGLSKNKKKGGGRSEDPSGYLSPDRNRFASGDPSGEHGTEKEIMVLRDKLGDFISSNMLGKGLGDPKTYAKSLFPLNHKSGGPFFETTITLPNIGNLKKIRLPKPVSAGIIPERVKGITSNNEEILLETEINSLGEATAFIGRDKVEKIVYSLQVSRDPLDRIIPEVNDSEYNAFQARFIKENGLDLKEDIADLPAELEFFAESLKSIPPKERIIAIEQFVKQYGYYDFKNGEVADMKNGRTVSEQIIIMKTRMDQLKELEPRLKGKKFAGVCADFALLNTALLRKAGILSGVASGFASGQKNIYPSMAHGVSYVVFPDKDNMNQVFIVDPTPAGTNAGEEKLLAGFREDSIAEKEAKAEEEIAAEKLDAYKSLDEIEKIIGLNDIEALKNLTNGKLEKALNTILKYEVKADNLKIISNLLSVYWYSPLNKIDFNDAGDQAYFRNTFKKEVERVKLEIEARPDSKELKERPSGSELFNLVKDFKNRFAKDGADNGLDLVDKIAELNRSELSDTEYKALTVISNYLRAKNVAG